MYDCSVSATGVFQSRGGIYRLSKAFPQAKGWCARFFPLPAFKCRYPYSARQCARFLHPLFQAFSLSYPIRQKDHCARSFHTSRTIVSALIDSIEEPIMRCPNIFLFIIAILFPPLASEFQSVLLVPKPKSLMPATVWVERGICSVDSLINIALCCLGYLPGLLHAWYIIAKYPEIGHEPRPHASEGPSSFPVPPPSQPPPPPPPPLPPYKPRGISNRPAIQKQPTAPEIGIGIGIETEFLLQSRDPNSEDVSLFRFARHCAVQYNEQVDEQHPRMHSLVQALWQGQPHTQWCLHYDPTCETRSVPCESVILWS